jgi:uncharacterized protein
LKPLLARLRFAAPSLDVGFAACPKGRVRGRLGVAICISVLATFWLCLCSTLAADIAFPPLTGRVVDQAGVLSEPAQNRLTAELAAHEQRTGQQVVVAIVRSLEGQSIEDYGYQLGRAWGIGQKDKNTGAILLVAPAEHKVRIEVGYGLEGDLTDAVSATIINGTILPRFRQGDVEGGIVAGTKQVLRALGDAVPAAGARAPMHQAQARGNGHGSIGSVLLTFLIFGLFMWFARRRGGGFGSGVVPFLIASSWSSRGGGGGFGGGSDGGGFSGGGGSFGGGGASGSW